MGRGEGGGGKDQFIGNEMSEDGEYHARSQKEIDALAFLSFKIVRGEGGQGGEHCRYLYRGKRDICARVAITYARASPISLAAARPIEGDYSPIMDSRLSDPVERVDEHSSNLRRNRKRFSRDLISTPCQS